MLSTGIRRNSAHSERMYSNNDVVIFTHSLYGRVLIGRMRGSSWDQFFENGWRADRTRCARLVTMPTIVGKKVTEQNPSVWRADGLGMKLHAFDRQLRMLQSHHLDHASALGRPSSHCQCFWHAIDRDAERMISSGIKALWHAAENSPATVLYDGCLSMHRLRCPLHHATVHLSDDLMTEADAKYRHEAGVRAHHIDTYPGFIRRTWTGRDDDVVWVDITNA